MTSWIAPEQTWILWAVLLSAAAFGLWAERTSLGARISGAVITLLTAFTLSNVGVLPVEAPAYGVVWSYLVPLAIPLLLFQADLRRIFREAGPTLIAFGIGAVGTVLGTWLAASWIPLGPEGWKLAGIFCATYVGGSMNYAAVAEAVGLRSGDLLTAGIAADNLMMTLYFLVLFALPASPWLRARYVQRDQGQPSGANPGEASVDGQQFVLQTSVSLALAAAFCAVGYAVADVVGLAGGGVVVATGLTVTLATLLPSRFGQLTLASRLGTVLMQVFFATIGASANIGVVLRAGPRLFVFAGVILGVHLLTLLSAGRLLRLDLAELVVASNANMGGPTTAAAMAVSRRWHALVLPAILCGTLGYASATFLGVAVAQWLR